MSGENLFLGVTVGLLGGALFGRDVSRLGVTLEQLKKKADASKAIKATVGGVLQLNRELKAMERAGLGATSAAERLRAKLDQQTKTLRLAGFNTRDLAGEYRRLGEAIKGAELYSRGRERIGQAMVDAGKFAAVVGTLSKPVRVSAEYQAIVRDIAIKAGVARTPQEAEMSERITTSARDNGMGRNDLAAAINEMVAGGMDLNRALSFAPLAAKFSVGQAAPGDETARMMRSLETNAEITDPATMRQAMEAIAYAGKAGSFESVDMARWFPVLLSDMQKLGITGMDSVTQLAAMLQVQAKTAGSSDEAANNLKNWFSKIGSGETKKHYFKNADINYEKEMNTRIAKGQSTMEASFELARQYIEKTDPAKAKAMANAAEQLSKVSDPAKAKAMAAAFAETMKTGDLFADMQVKAALAAYMQNRELYDRIKREATEAAKEGKQIEKDLADRRAESKRIWNEVGQSWDDLMVRMGAALSPLTDRVGKFASQALDGVAGFAKDHPDITSGAAAVGVAGAAYLAGKATMGLIRGAIDLARGANLLRGKGKLLDAVDKLAGGKGGAGGAKGGNGGGLGGVGGALGDLVGDVQKVFVVNMPGSLGGGGGLPDAVPGDAGKPGKPTGKPAGKPKAGRLGAARNAVKVGLEKTVKAGRAVASAVVKGGRAALPVVGRVLASPVTMGAALLTYAGSAGNPEDDKIFENYRAKAAAEKRATTPAPGAASPAPATRAARPGDTRPAVARGGTRAAATTTATVAPAQAAKPAASRPTATTSASGGAPSFTININGAGLTADQVKSAIVRELDAWWRRQQAAAKASARGGLHDGATVGAR